MSALDKLLLKKYRETVDELPTGLNDTQSIEELANSVLQTTSEVKYQTAETISISTELPIVDIAEAIEPRIEEEIDRDFEQEVTEPEAEEPVTEDLAAEEQLVTEQTEVVSEDIHEVATEDMIDETASVEIQINFKPDWEIDRFPWPAICGEIEDRVESELETAMNRITDACEQRACNTVLLTSARTGLGRTTMTLCLAREAAKQGLTVAIVDLDHAEPSMLVRMGIDFEQGIESLNEEGVSTESICVTAVEDGVSLVPTAKAFDAAQCESDETREMLHTIAKHHDLVLIDASREVADLIAGSQSFPAQCIIMVNDPGAGEATQAFLEWIQQKDAWTLGVIENFAA